MWFEIIGLAVGGVGTYWYLNRSFAKAIENFDHPRSRFEDGHLSYRHALNFANCSSDLSLRLEKLDMKNMGGVITGFDASYFASPRADVLNSLIEKIGAGERDVKYLFTSPDHATIKRNLKDVAQKVLAEGLNVTFYAFDWENAEGEDLIALAEEMKTEHVTVINSDDGDFLWIEGNHPAGETIAYGIDCIPPKAMVGKNKDDFEIYHEKVDLLLAHSTELNLQSLAGQGDVRNAA